MIIFSSSQIKITKIGPFLLLLTFFAGACGVSRIIVPSGRKTTYEEVPGARHESAVDQANAYVALKEVVGKLSKELPATGKTALVAVVKDAKTDVVLDLLYEAAIAEGKEVVKVSYEQKDQIGNDIVNRFEVYVRQAGIHESVTEIPKSQILVAKLNNWYWSPAGNIARMGIFFTVLIEGRELGRARRVVEMSVTARLIEQADNKLIWSKNFKAKNGSIM